MWCMDSCRERWRYRNIPAVRERQKVKDRRKSDSRTCGKCGGAVEKFKHFCVACRPTKRGRQTVPLVERVRRSTRIDHQTGCHIWAGTVSDKGYPRVRLPGGGDRKANVRTVCWEWEHGTLQPGDVLVASCGVVLCVNPGHLRAERNGHSGGRVHAAWMIEEAARRAPERESRRLALKTERLERRVSAKADLARARAEEKARIKAERAARRLGDLSEQRARIIEAYGGRCACCGLANRDLLAIDHVNGDGAEHRRERGPSWYADVIRRGFPAEFRVLCHNCNFASGRYGRCPHEDMLEVQGAEADGPVPFARGRDDAPSWRVQGLPVDQVQGQVR
jgi:hypothetical protein